MASALLQLKAESYRLALEKMTGIPVQIVYGDSTAKVYWTPENAVRLRQWISSQLAKKPKQPSDIDFQLEPAIRPLVLQKVLPWVVSILGIGIAVGIIIGRKI